MRKPQQELSQLDEKGLRRKLRTIQSPQTPHLIANGESLINFSANDYLGLANDAYLKDEYRKAIDTYGVGSGASRLISGTMDAHLELEETIAEIKNTEAALTFSSGFAAATGSIPAIVGKQDFVILDKLCHASLIDGAKLSGATIRVFPHNDIEKLEAHLKWANNKKAADSRVLIITESVFSMDGDLAPLAEICQLKNRFEALLLVDEAHAIGVLGPQGRGLAAELEVESSIDFQMGTFSKAIGLSGGYLCATKDWIDWLINRARSFIYSTAPSPSLAATISSSLKLVSSDRGDLLREKLWNNIKTLDSRAQSAIVPVLIGENHEALQTADELRQKGYLIPAIRYPTVPRGTARLRITLSAAHTVEEIEQLASELANHQQSES